MQALEKLVRLVSASRNRQLTDWGLLSDVENWWRYHHDLMVENWYYYAGFHQLFFRKFDGEDDKEFAARINDATIENHVRPIVDLIVSHLYGDPKRIKRYIKRNEDTDEELMKFFKYHVWNVGKQPLVDDAKALNALITGYTVLQRKFIDMRSMKPFERPAGIKDKLKYGVIVKKPLDSTYCVPLPYTDENGYVDSTKLGAVVYIAETDNLLGKQELHKLLGKPYRKKWVMEYVDDRLWLRWQKDEEHSEWYQVTVNPGTPYQNLNQYRDITVPFTVVRNTGDPFYIEGDSDVDPLKSLSVELNELASGDKDTIRYHQYPILQGREGGKLPAGFVRSKNAVIENDEGYLEYLTWEGNLQESQNRQDTIRRALSYASQMSLISRGFLREIGYIRSGPPLKAMFTSERSAMLRKFTTFGACEEDEMRADIKMYEFHTTRDFKVDPTVTFHTDFDIDFLSIDELLREEIKTLKKTSQTESLEDIIKEEHPDWTEEEVQEAIKDIKKAEETKGGNGQQKGQLVSSPEKKELQQSRTGE